MLCNVRKHWFDFFSFLTFCHQKRTFLHFSSILLNTNNVAIKLQVSLRGKQKLWMILLEKMHIFTWVTSQHVFNEWEQIVKKVQKYEIYRKISDCGGLMKHNYHFTIIYYLTLVLSFSSWQVYKNNTFRQLIYVNILHRKS